MSAPGHRLLDLTRLLSRAGRGLTGVDRVERAYLRRFIADDAPVHALIATRAGFLLLDQSGMVAFDAALDSGQWGARGFLSLLSFRLSPERQAALTLARRLAVDRCARRGLLRMLARHMPGGADYYNTGHSNLTERGLRALGTLPGMRRNVLIHDVIPLDYPQFQRPGTVEIFAGKLRRSLVYADRIICNSQDTANGIARHAKGRIPPLVVAHLGVDPAIPDPAALPDLPRDRPWFVTLGTIEPRKNHALLLDIWDRFGNDPQAPRLFICGARGWNNDALFARLDRGLPLVTELAGLSDGAVAALLAGSHGLLFPSLAEGFGLPPVEAAAMGVPVICGDLAITREVLGNTPVYLNVSDSYLWEQTISRLIRHPQRPRAITPPDWERHFNIVLSHE